MVIRDVKPEDFAAIADITNPYIERTPVHFSYHPVTADELRAGWAKGADRYPYLVGVEGAAGVVGYAKAGLWRERAAYDRTAEVGIYLREEFQGKGLGRLLYEALIRACRAKGFHVLVGGITLPNEASEQLHRACGFELVGSFREVGWKFERWHDVGFYQLLL